jgi:hypothetical protein
LSIKNGRTKFGNWWSGVITLLYLAGLGFWPYAEVSEFLGHALLNILKSWSLQSADLTLFFRTPRVLFRNRAVVRKVARQTIETPKPLSHRELVLCSKKAARQQRNF